MSPALIQEIVDDEPVRGTLELTPIEQDLRRLLLDVANHISATPSATTTSQVKLPDDLAQQGIILRFTGGWVRDKLLGVDSHDIDVAINNMTGEQFALRMKEYLELPGIPEKYGLQGVASSEKQNSNAGATDKSKLVGGLHKIEANPEKSKHLETITTKILGLDIDLVNLRKESYTEDSRNPQIEFGTPEEDALRRDATVNAMFYNLNTEEIEDFTNQGHQDMRGKLIRTPLDPFQTFRDDPLRVLRLIRFASRLHYTIDDAALTAMRDPIIKDALQRKISRERVGVELEKALRGPDPHEALRLIFDLELYFTIFSDPTTSDGRHYLPETAGWQTIIDTLENIVDEDRSIAKLALKTADERFLAWQLSALVPYRGAPQPEPAAPGRKPPPPVAASVAREGIKATNKVCDLIVAAVRNHAEISSFVEGVFEKKTRPHRTVTGDDLSARDILGMAIRRWGPTWKSQVIYAFLGDLVEASEESSNSKPSGSSHEGFLAKILIDVERKYTVFLEHAQELDIMEAFALKPLLDGKALAKALNTPPGPWMKDSLDVVMAWQLRNPNSSATQDVIEEVRRSRGELSFALATHFLTLTIRPLFARSKPSTVTAAGRKNTAEVLPTKLSMHAPDEMILKPWKDVDGHFALSLLKWSVQALDEKSIETVWPLLIPPILTLLDDWETKYKVRGASLLRAALSITPPALLQRTGLGSVFEDALLPSLAYVPPLTPESESIELLDTVYPALLTLAAVRFPEKAGSSDHSRQWTKSLDAVLQKGILHSFSTTSSVSVSQYPRLTGTLFNHLTSVLDALGIASVKHLKFLLPTLNETLSNPETVSLVMHHRENVDMLRNGLSAMQAIIRNGWPRMWIYRGEVLKGLVGVWLGVVRAGQESEAEMVSEIKRLVRETMVILQSSFTCEDETSRRELFKEEWQQLVESDPTLAPMIP